MAKAKKVMMKKGSVGRDLTTSSMTLDMREQLEMGQ